MQNEATAQLFDLGAHNPSFESIRRESANRADPIDFCVPVNRYFPPPSLLEEIQEALPRLLKFYPDYAEVHQDAIAHLSGVPNENIIVANGSTEMITLLSQHCVGPMATPVPTFGRWTDLPMENGTPVSFIHRRREDGFRLSVDRIVSHVRQHGIRTLVLCNPNNPTGASLSPQEITRLVSELKHLDRIIIDESFIDFAGIESAASLAVKRNNLIVLKSLGKSVGWHGIRLGYVVGDVDQIKRLRAHVPYWNINGIAAFVLQRIAELDVELKVSFEQVRNDRDQMYSRLSRVPRLTVYPSTANFLFAELPSDVSGKTLRDQMLSEHNMLLRECGNKLGSSDRYLRLAVNKPDENEKLAVALESLLGE